MGTILYWSTYLISGVSLYTILAGTYKLGKIEYPKCPYYVRKETNERYKLPLWLIILCVIIFTVPILNLLLFAGLILSLLDNDRDFYYKTFLTKRC